MIDNEFVIKLLTIDVCGGFKKFNTEKEFVKSLNDNGVYNLNEDIYKLLVEKYVKDVK